MNVREGMRRFGIVLGVLGGITGGIIGYVDFRNVWSAHPKSDTSPSDASSINLPPGFVLEEPGEQRKDSSGAPQTLPADFFDKLARQQGGSVPENPLPPPGFVPIEDLSQQDIYDLIQVRELLKAKGDPRAARVDALIQSQLVEKVKNLRASDKTQGNRTLGSGLRMILRLLLPFLYPIAGFFVPWGTTKVFVWVGSGFISPPRSA